MTSTANCTVREHHSDDRSATNTPTNVEKRTSSSSHTLNKNQSCWKSSSASPQPSPPHCSWIIIVNRWSTVWWLAGQINMTGSGYKHVQRRAVTAHVRPAICPVLLPSIRSAAVYMSHSIYSARSCRLFAADQPHFLASYTLKVWFSGADPCAPVALVSQEQKVEMLKHIAMCHLWEH